MSNEKIGRDGMKLTTTNLAPPASIELFIFDPTDFSTAYPMFGVTDRLVVWSNVAAAYPNELNDFEFIGSKNSDRDQFIADSGIQIATVNPLWHTSIEEVGLMGGDVRVSVSASIGADVSEFGGIRMGVEQTVYEIWKLDPVGNQPILLDRSLEFFDGLSTHAEVPPFTIPWPTEEVKLGTRQPPNQ